MENTDNKSEFTNDVSGEQVDITSDAADKTKKIKLAVVAAGLVFILVAAVYAAAVFGGRTNSIPTQIPDTIAVVQEPTPTAVPTKPVPTVTVIQEVEEETSEESLVAIMPGNRRYDECIYADGGVVLVRTGELYGAMDYEGKEIVPVNYAQIIERPTRSGRFILANSVAKSVTKEEEGVTLSYEETVTTYTMFDNKGTKVYEGIDPIYTADDVYLVAVTDDNIAKNRIDYYRYDAKKSPFMTMYVKDTLSMIGFMHGKTVVNGFTAIPTEDQDTNPTNLYSGIMDEKGNVDWFATALGINEFSLEVAKWKEDNKDIKISRAKKKKTINEPQTTYDEDGNEIYVDDEYEENEQDDEDTQDQIDDVELTEEELDDIEEEVELSGGPQFHLENVLNAPNRGYFVCNDPTDVLDSYTFYDEKGMWQGDLDTSYMAPDDKKGFVAGNFNNGAVTVSKYISEGQLMWHYGSCMVLNIGKKDVLIDMSKAKGLKSDTVNNRIVLAVYDDIALSEADYWVYKDGDKCGYIDHSGKPVKEAYSDATSFVDGFALVVKDGKAIIINEDFEQLEEIGEASNVDIKQDLLMVLHGGTTKNYILKVNKDNLLTTEQETDDEDPKKSASSMKQNKN